MTDYLIITSDSCKWCEMAKDALTIRGHSVKTLNLDEHPELFIAMQAIGAKTVPQVLKVIGGYEATMAHLNPVEKAEVEIADD